MEQKTEKLDLPVVEKKKCCFSRKFAKQVCTYRGKEGIEKERERERRIEKEREGRHGSKEPVPIHHCIAGTRVSNAVQPFKILKSDDQLTINSCSQ